MSDDGVAAGGVRSLVELSPIRRAIGQQMVDSKREAPHFYVEAEVPMDGVLALTDGASTRAPGLTVSSVLVRACCVALRAHPRLNAVWTDKGLEQVDAVNIGIAVALDGGVVAPALLNAESLDLAATSAALADLIARARAKRLRPAEVSQGTFTFSNLGMFDVARFTAIVVPRQVAILAVGRSVERAVVVDGRIAPRPMMSATVSADHRAVDGADVAAFLETYKRLLEKPEQLDG